MTGIKYEINQALILFVSILVLLEAIGFLLLPLKNIKRKKKNNRSFIQRMVLTKIVSKYFIYKTGEDINRFGSCIKECGRK